jgi:Na+-transporting NADH:ubiquinone oxidoreductase subunit NqrB
MDTGTVPIAFDTKCAGSFARLPRIWPKQADPRLFQIATLGLLLVIGITRFDLAASAQQLAVTLLAAMATQALAGSLAGAGFDWRSPMITALSLSLLLRTHDPRLWAAAGMIAIGSKFALRLGEKHIFNPACLAIVTLLLLGQEVWVSPGQWGALAWGAGLLAAAACLVLSCAQRVDIAASFLGAWSALLAARCIALGDPWAIPLHQVQSGSLLIFAFFMITDPRSTPNSRMGRIVFALAVAGLGHWLIFYGQIRVGLFYALMTVSFTTPLLDRVLAGKRFSWRRSAVVYAD